MRTCIDVGLLAAAKSDDLADDASVKSLLLDESNVRPATQSLGVDGAETSAAALNLDVMRSLSKLFLWLTSAAGGGGGDPELWALPERKNLPDLV